MPAACCGRPTVSASMLPSCEALVHMSHSSCCTLQSSYHSVPPPCWHTSWSQLVCGKVQGSLQLVAYHMEDTKTSAEVHHACQCLGQTRCSAARRCITCSCSSIASDLPKHRKVSACQVTRAQLWGSSLVVGVRSVPSAMRHTGSDDLRCQCSLDLPHRVLLHAVLAARVAQRMASSMPWTMEMRCTWYTLPVISLLHL